MTSSVMILEALRAIALEELAGIAPDLAEETIPLDADLREYDDLESMDLLN